METVKAVGPILFDGRTDQSAAVRSHEVNDLRGYALSRANKVSFVLPVFVIHDDHYFSGPDISDSRFDIIQLDIRMISSVLRVARHWF